MNIAVIGANGFVGTRLVEILHLGGHHTVVPVVRRPSALALAARFKLPFRIADALDPVALADALASCDAAIHVALGDPRQIAAMPAAFCAAAAAARVPRVLYLSSASVHGQAPAPDTTDASPLHTRHALDYNNAKVRAERAFFAACTRHRLAGFALRPGVVFGPRSRWIADLAADLRHHRAWLLRDGSGLCNSCYVDNLVAALLRCLVAPPAAAGAYLVGDANPPTWGELYRDVARALALDPATIHLLPAAPAFARSPAEHLAGVIAGPAAQAVLPLVPGRLKQLAKRLAAAALAPSFAPDSWQLPRAPGPRVTQELALLQQNTWRLSSARAARLLGYAPVVDHKTALDRSLAWLAFAEGRS
jgi:nucleoside-diphosphate-sugar epimerase